MSRTANSTLVDPFGRSVSLAPKPFAVGGEGQVFDVVGDAAIVAKVYNTPQPPDRSEKLRSMARLAAPDLLKIAAWPTATLHQSPGGPVVGILMPRVAGYKEIHHLYSVAQRKKDYPEAHWGFLVHAAMNCAIAFDEVHRHGHVVGDVNQKNVLVSDHAVVRFVDCDSFQVRSPDGRTFRCIVGVPEYTPPELQGRSFRDMDRDANHDRFGLAVLIFHLLMMGRHPFSGVFLDPGDMPLERAIREGRFAYSRDVRAARMKPPPNTVPMTILDRPMIDLFERAFAPIAAGRTPARPTAAEWRNALKAFGSRLGPCKADPKHIYPKAAGPCPWCVLLGSSGLMFFLPGVPTIGRTALAFDLLATWGRIERVALPVFSYARPGPANAGLVSPRPIPSQLPMPTPRMRPLLLPTAPTPLDPFFERIATVGLLAGLLVLQIAPPIGIVCLVGFGGWLGFLLVSQGSRKDARWKTYREEKQRITELNEEQARVWALENPQWAREYAKRVATRDALITQLDTLESELAQVARAASESFRSLHTTLESARTTYEHAKKAHAQEMAQLAKRSGQLQLEHHLNAHLIRDARLQAITSQRILSLSSFGIETALDVEYLRNIKVPGIGPVLTDRLLHWRDSLIRTFKPKPGLPDAERTAVEQKYVPRLRQLETILGDGPAQLQTIASELESRKIGITRHIQRLVDLLHQAILDVEIMDQSVEEEEPWELSGYS